jgi:excisionase family DNA binding protein
VELDKKTELTPDDAAEITGYSAGHIRWLARHGKIKGRRVGVRVWLIDAESLTVYVEKMRELGNLKHSPS